MEKKVVEKEVNIDFNTAPDRRSTNAEKYVYTEKLFGSEDVLPMWVADMDIQTPSFIMDAIKDRVQHPILGYEEASDKMFEAQINWFKRQDDYEMKREWMFQSPSVVGSINVAIKAFSEIGDKIIVQSPVYPKFYTSVSNNERVVLDNPLKENDGYFSMDLDDLEAKIDNKTRMIILCSPHNPVGRVWTKDELIRLGEICIKHDIIIVADEVHSDLIYKGFKHIPLASISKELEKRTVSCYGPGKTFNMAGLATSTVCVPSDELRVKFKKAYEATYFGDGTIFGQIAFEAAYTQGEFWLRDLITHLQGNIDYLDLCLKEYMPLIKMTKPEGTYLAWLDCRGLGLPQDALEKFFYKDAKLGLSSGIGFGEVGQGFMRINLATPRSTVQEAVSRLHSAYKTRYF